MSAPVRVREFSYTQNDTKMEIKLSQRFRDRVGGVIMGNYAITG